MTTINEIEMMGEGTLVTANGEYAKLAYLNNEYPYYSLVDETELSDDEIEEAVKVSDFDEDHLDCLQ